MKNILKLINLIVISVLFLIESSCSKNEVPPLFEQSINERTDALKNKYLDILTAPENGWICNYTPNKNFGAYTVLMKFDKKQAVSIKSDYKTGQIDNSITYRLDKTLKIELVLESFSVFHDIFEINGNDNKGEFVFNILSATSDEVVLESKLDSGDDITVFTLRKAKATDSDLTAVYTSINNLVNDGTQSIFRNILLNNKAIASFDFSTTTRLTTISYIENAKEVTVNVPIAITATGFNFIKPLTILGTTLTSFTFDSVNKQFVNEADKLKIIYSNKPLILTDDYKQLLPGNTNNVYGYIDANLAKASSNSLLFNSLVKEVNASLPVGVKLSRVQLHFNDSGFNYIGYRFTGGKTTIYHNIDTAEDAVNKTIVFSDVSWESNTGAPLLPPAFLKNLDDQFMTASGLYVKKENFNIQFTNDIFTFTSASSPFRMTTYAFQ
jgi:Domain of unknown function (DUF4302)